MKKIVVLTILFLLVSTVIFAQKIELTGGLGKNYFFGPREETAYFYSSYSSEWGYTAGIGIEDIKVERLTLRFTFSYSKYGGHLEYSSSGLAGGSSTNVSIDKSIISFGFFPLNFRLKDRVDLNLGFEISKLFNETFEGRSGGWSRWGGNWGGELQEQYSRISALSYFGLRARLAYDLLLTEDLAISPQYAYYLGLTNEFENILSGIHSMRHYFGIGIERKF